MSIRFAIDIIPKETFNADISSVIAGGMLIGGVYGNIGIDVGIIFSSPRKGDKAMYKMIHPDRLRMKGITPNINSSVKTPVEKHRVGIALAWQCGHSISLIMLLPALVMLIFFLNKIYVKMIPFSPKKRIKF